MIRQSISTNRIMSPIINSETWPPGTITPFFPPVKHDSGKGYSHGKTNGYTMNE